MEGRALTYDEQKAAEAAFSAKPFNPSWSANAKVIYFRILDAMPGYKVKSEMELAYER